MYYLIIDMTNYGYNDYLGETAEYPATHLHVIQ